ncbi:ABC transporter permease [Desulfatibacillum aliphaticivorans]|uniref:ABC transporter permease n=1 Tax=Desulfatibacillum aliphaticivorans TaxID=218208 RepID=UPI0003FCE972|nr:ABC transporter permease [Desulfatibacillum aliphaticivorans]
MKWFKFIKVALQSILKNRMRSLLTMLGVIIGVGSVITLMALGEGSQKDIKAQISSMGTNLLMIHSGAGRSGGVRLGSGSLATITMDDVKALREKSTTLMAVSPNIRVSEQVIAGNANWSTSVEGVSPDYLTIRNYEIASGTFFTERDVKTRAKAAVLGQTVAQELFGDRDPLGARIRVRNVPFKVIGVLAEKGQSSMGNDQDDVIFTPSTTALYRLSDGKTLRVIMASAVSEEKMDAAEKEITQILRAQHKLSASEEDDFNIRSQTEIINMASQMTGALTALLSAIAGVSLLVGGIGIMNIMLVSVTERTREIGIRMAVGARGSDIMAQFLVEAIILSLIGGVFGIVLGLGLAFGLGAILGCSVVTNLAVILTAVAFTAGVGVFFGFYPARKAAGLHPIEALRYE